MISRIIGLVKHIKENAIILASGSIAYEILMPIAVMKAMGKDGLSGEVELVTYHYYQMDPSRAVPILIGFQNEIEKEFFEKFISVSGIGPKAACKALIEPFSIIASAIDSGDTSFLKRLPGIGDERARLIVAKLQGKVGKYGLLRDRFVVKVKERDDARNEALEILLQLQYKRNEAEEMLQRALERTPDVKTSEDLLNEVYREKKSV